MPYNSYICYFYIPKVFNMCANFTLGKDTEGMSGFLYKRGSVKNVEDSQAEVCHSCLCLLPCSIC